MANQTATTTVPDEEQLGELTLTPEEYDAARSSTLNAFYTSPTVINAMYEALGNMAKFHNYSFNNTLLIALQKPDATLVAGYQAWQKKFKIRSLLLILRE